MLKKASRYISKWVCNGSLIQKSEYWTRESWPHEGPLTTASCKSKQDISVMVILPFSLMLSVRVCPGGSLQCTGLALTLGLGLIDLPEVNTGSSLSCVIAVRPSQHVHLCCEQSEGCVYWIICPWQGLMRSHPCSDLDLSSDGCSSWASHVDKSSS